MPYYLIPLHTWCIRELMQVGHVQRKYIIKMLIRLLLSYLVGSHAAFTHGKKFNLGFMNNLGGNTHGLYLVFTTTSPGLFPVKVQVATGYALSVNISSSSAGFVSFNRNQMVSNSDIANRHKGIQVSSEQESFSVLALNLLRGSYGEYLAYPCHDLELDNYTYIAVSTKSKVSTAHSQILLVGCQDNTTITITPTHPVVLPQDAQVNESNITVEAGASHTIVLHELQTLLLKNLKEDLSNTRIVANKPLTVISGHQCGNIPNQEQFCEHLTVQIPPTATWGTEFLLSHFERRSSQVFRAISSERNTTIQKTCNSSIEPVIEGYVFTKRYTYCSLSSNKPIFVTQWARGGQTDRIGDPVVTPVPPMAQYINRVSFFVYPRSLFAYNYITVTVPAEHFGEDSILLDETPITCSWTPIYNASNGTVGYGCNQPVSSGTHIMSHANTTGRLSVMVYGYHLYRLQAYAYIAGMKLEILTLKGIIYFFHSEAN